MCTIAHFDFHIKRFFEHWILVIFFSCCSFVSFSQQSSIDSVNSSSSPSDKKYFKNLFCQIDKNESSLFSFSYQYLYIPKTTALKTGGTHFEIGLNLARFFTKKFIFGVNIDHKFFPGYTKQSFSQDFKNDFNVSYSNSNFTKEDSLTALSLKEVINGSEGAFSKGSLFTHFGLTLSPFPQKFGGIMLKAKIGSHSYPFYGSAVRKIVGKDGGNLSLKINNTFAIELSCMPYKFFEHGNLNILESSIKDAYKFIIVSIYFERINLKYSTFNDIPFSQLAENSFIEKHGNFNNYGIKLGFAFW